MRNIAKIELYIYMFKIEIMLFLYYFVSVVWGSPTPFHTCYGEINEVFGFKKEKKDTIL